jgi:hypothetical protein
MAVERGVIGLATFVFFVFMLFRTLRQVLPSTTSRLDYALVAGLLATFTGYFVHGLFEVSYYDYKVLLLFWLLVGMAAAIWRLHFDRVPASFAALAGIEAESALQGSGPS